MRINLNVINHLNVDAESFRTLDVAEFIEIVLNGIKCDDMTALVYEIWSCVDNNLHKSWVYQYHTDNGQVKTCVISTEE